MDGEGYQTLSAKRGKLFTLGVYPGRQCFSNNIRNKKIAPQQTTGVWGGGLQAITPSTYPIKKENRHSTTCWRYTKGILLFFCGFKVFVGAQWNTQKSLLG